MMNDIQHTWNESFDELLRAHYGLTTADAGITTHGLMALRSLHSDPEHAVWAYGAAFGLEPMPDWWRP